MALDLDAAAAARREARKEPVEVIAAGQKWLLPIEMPLDVLAPLLDVPLDMSVFLAVDSEVAARVARDMLAAEPKIVQQGIDAIRRVIARLFCDEDALYMLAAKDQHGPDCQWTRFATAVRPAWQDLVELAKGLAGEYGVNLGEALSSPSQGSGDSETSRPTSPVSAKRTRAGASSRKATLTS